MCAIVGFSVLNRRLYRKSLASVMLTFAGAWAAAECRGTDASGIFIVGPKGKGETFKGTAKPWEILGLLDTAKIRTSIGVIAHTRQATSGSPAVNGNNHPITVGAVTGVHNGILFGYADLQKKYDCKLDVDSEVLMAILNDAKDDIIGVRRILDEVTGSVTLAWARRGQQHISLFSDGLNGLHLIPILDKGVVFFSSSELWLFGANGVYELEPNCYLKLAEEKITRVLLPYEPATAGSKFIYLPRKPETKAKDPSKAVAGEKS